MTGSALRAATGCLTDAGLDALEGAAPGQAPEELARHLAGCPRCQDRVLVRAGGVAGRRRERTARRPLWVSLAVVMGAMLAALVALLSTLFWINSSPR